MTEWVQVVCEVPEEEVDAVSGLLWAAGVAGVEEQAGGVGVVRLVTGVGSGVVAGVLRALDGQGYGAEVVEVAADAGLDGWRDFAQPVRVGGVEVWPEWLAPHDVDPDVVIVRLDAGRSFGHGAHVTTRLALELVQRVCQPGLTVLDVGTGSGVLALAAVALGASSVVAVDTAPEAVAAAEHNVSLNGFDDVIDVRLGTVPDEEAVVDLVVANVEAPILVELGSALALAVAPGGCLIVSGFLEEREGDVLAAMAVVEHPGVTERVVEDGWVALLIRWTS